MSGISLGRLQRRNAVFARVSWGSFSLRRWREGPSSDMIVGERHFTWHEVLEGAGKGYRGKRAMEVGQWQGSSCLGLEYR